MLLTNQVTRNITLNIFMVFALAIFIAIAFITLGKKEKLLNTFIFMVVLNIALLVLESVGVKIDSKPGKLYYYFQNIIYLLLFSVGLFLSFFWYFIMKKYFKPSNKNFIKLEKIIMIIQVVNLITILLSPFLGLVFKINSDNGYERGPLFLNHSLALTYFLFLALYLLIREKKYILNKDFVVLLISIIIPLIAGAIQVINYGIIIIWATTALSLIITYVFLRQKMFQYDDLTKAWNRQSFFDYIRSLSSKKDKCVGGLFLDLDNFKEINDTKGHAHGDDILVLVVRTIKDIINKNIIARIGGDEFVAIIETNSLEELNIYKEKIKYSLNNLKVKDNTVISIDVSIGAKIFDVNYETYQEFLEKIDVLMYEDKNNSKIKNGRK